MFTSRLENTSSRIVQALVALPPSRSFVRVRIGQDAGAANATVLLTLSRCLETNSSVAFKYTEKKKRRREVKGGTDTEGERRPDRSKAVGCVVGTLRNVGRFYALSSPILDYVCCLVTHRATAVNRQLD